jgi:anti-sigma regulatory factor (Ser/Thr protein kinase)
MSLTWGGGQRTWAVELRAGPGTAAEARWFLLDALRGRDEPLDVETAALLTSEAASNAALHGKEPIELSVTLEDEGLRVSVLDQGPGFDPEDEALPGTGLTLIRALSSDWGARQTQEGTEVWFKV